MSDIVYAHVERTVRAICDAITAALPAAVDPDARDGSVTPEGIKVLAEAVQALSSWRTPHASAIAIDATVPSASDAEIARQFRQDNDAYSTGPKVPACNCDLTVYHPLRWHAADCSSRSYQYLPET